MKIYNKKYLFIGILSALVTACGSGGGGGGSSSNSPSASTPSPTVSSKPTTNIVAPVNPVVNPEKTEGKPMVPVISEVNKPNSGDNGDNPNLPVVEEKEDIVPPPFERPPLKNSGTITVKDEGMVALLALDDETAINEKTGVINVSTKHSNAILALGKTAKGINEGTIIGTQSDLVETMKLMEGAYGANLENNGTIKGTGISISAMSNRSNHGEGFTSVNNGDIELNGNNESNLYYTSLIGMEWLVMEKIYQLSTRELLMFQEHIQMV
ncbi:MAG: hypothetical protein ACRCXS_05625 [Cetobacterium sp.]